MTQLDLAQIQRRFMGFVQGDDHDPSDFIAGNNRQSAPERLQIYRNSVRANLILALGDIFPVTRQLLGDAFFDAMAQRFVAVTPSRSASLDDYGEEFEDFCRNFRPLKDLPYIPDVVRFEWLWHRVFHAQDDTRLDLEQLARLSPEQQAQAVFRPKHAMQVFESDYPISRIWLSHQVYASVHDSDRTATGRDIKEVSLDEGAETILIWRDGYTMRTDPVAREQAYFLNLLSKQISFGDLCQQWAAQYPEADIGRISGLAAQNGWITDFVISENLSDKPQQ